MRKSIGLLVSMLLCPLVSLGQPTSDFVADWNNDGSFDTSDYSAFMTDYNANPQVEACDFNRDGTINSVDILKFSNTLYGNRLPVGTVVIYLPAVGDWDESYLSMEPWETINGFVFDSYDFVYIDDYFERDTNHDLDGTWTTWAPANSSGPFGEVLRLKTAYDDYKVISDGVKISTANFGTFYGGNIQFIETTDNDYVSTDDANLRVWPDRMIYLFPPSVTTGIPTRYSNAVIDGALMYAPYSFYPHYLDADLLYDQPENVSYTTTNGKHKFDDYYYMSNIYHPLRVTQDSVTGDPPDLTPVDPRRKYLLPIDPDDPFDIIPGKWSAPFGSPLITPTDLDMPLVRREELFYQIQCDNEEISDRDEVDNTDYEGGGSYTVTDPADINNMNCDLFGASGPILVITSISGCDFDTIISNLTNGNTTSVCDPLQNIYLYNLDDAGPGKICLGSGCDTRDEWNINLVDFYENQILEGCCTIE